MAEILGQGDAQQTAGPSPEQSSSWPSYLTWSWMSRLMNIGYYRPLQDVDLYDMRFRESAKHCAEVWEAAWAAEEEGLLLLRKEAAAAETAEGTTEEKAPVRKELREAAQNTQGLGAVAAIASEERRLVSVSVVRVFLRAFGREYFAAALWKPCWLVAVVLQVYALRALVTLSSPSRALHWPWASFLVFAMFLTSCVQSISVHHCFTLSQKSGMKLRAAVCAAVYKKTLRMRLAALSSSSVSSGHLINVITNDTQKLLDALTYFHMVWFSVIELTVICALVVAEAGVSALGGVAVVLITQPIQIWMARRVAQFRPRALSFTDARVRLVGEAITHVRALKFNGWTPSFLDRIQQLRGEELQWIKRAAQVRASNTTLKDSVTPFASAVTFGLYVALHGGTLDPPVAFTVLALFSIMVRIFFIVPTGLQFFGEGLVAVKRLEKVLSLPEGDTKAQLTAAGPNPACSTPTPASPPSPLSSSSHTTSGAPSSSSSPAPAALPLPSLPLVPSSPSTLEPFTLAAPSAPDSPLGRGGKIPSLPHSHNYRVIASIRGGTFCWQLPQREKFGHADKRGSSTRDGSQGEGATVTIGEKAEKTFRSQDSNFCLTGIELSVEDGEVLGIRGPVGSGKTSLLLALLSEMKTLAGSVSLSSSVAYASQQPWILNSSLRSNILFISPFQEKRYRAVLRACSLEADIAELPAGEETEIGERGVNLSGGQKARVALARALYSPAKLVLLDDPFAAVDVKTGAHMVRSVLGRAGGGGDSGSSGLEVENGEAIDDEGEQEELQVRIAEADRRQGERVEIDGVVEAHARASSGRDEREDDEEEFMRGRTVVVVAHSELALGHCTRVVRMEAGRLVGQDAPGRGRKMRDGWSVEGVGGQKGSPPETWPLLLEENEAPTVDSLCLDESTPTLTRPEAADPVDSAGGRLAGGGEAGREGGEGIEDHELHREAEADAVVKQTGITESASVDSLIDDVLPENVKKQPKRLPPSGAPGGPKLTPWLSRIGTITVKEDRTEGRVTPETYLDYCVAAGGAQVIAAVAASFVIAQGCRTLVDYWLGVWVDGAFHLNAGSYAAVYAFLAAAASALSLLRARIFTSAALSSARNMHDCMAVRVLRSPLLFFDQNPAGRILNRFSKDQSLVDELLPSTAQITLELFLGVLGSLVVISILVPFFLISIPPLLLVFLLLQRRYVRVSRELKRIDGLSRSPVFAHFSQSLQGLVTIRAFSSRQLADRSSPPSSSTSPSLSHALTPSPPTTLSINNEPTSSSSSSSSSVIFSTPTAGSSCRVNPSILPSPPPPSSSSFPVSKSLSVHTSTPAASPVPPSSTPSASSLFSSHFLDLIDANHRAYILFVHAGRWLGLRLDLCAAVCVTVVSLLVVILRGTLPPGFAGVILVQSLQLTGLFQYAVRQAAETENYFTSVERIRTYTRLETEADEKSPPGALPADWPRHGVVAFRDYWMKYRVELPYALQGLDFQIEAKEKVGILGRTGSGKSSLAAALFRLVENEASRGRILIDGVDLRHVGLDDLRQRLSIIPQDPVLFRGTVRSNLDPFGSSPSSSSASPSSASSSAAASSDAHIWLALRAVHLGDKIAGMDGGLDCHVAENGENLSVGQRQLLCLARALLRKSRVLVMDEATAAVDSNTDTHIQSSIRTVFASCTVLTIAHRIDTVIDCDKVLLLAGGGRVEEFGSPASLLRKRDGAGKAGMFASMVQHTGSGVREKLEKAAREAEETRLREKRMEQEGGGLCESSD